MITHVFTFDLNYYNVYKYIFLFKRIEKRFVPKYTKMIRHGILSNFTGVFKIRITVFPQFGLC